MRLLLDRLARSAEAITDDLGHEPESQAGWWAGALTRQCQAARDELAFLAPWTGLPDAPDELGDLPEINAIPTLRALAGLDVALSTRLASRVDVDATPTRIA